MSLRDQHGPFFGDFGGRYMPESLVAAIDELTVAYEEAIADPEFRAELAHLLSSYAGRPSALTEVPRFAEHAGGARVFLKREDLNHTGSHKINNVLGQALLTKRLGKTRVIAETGAGQHGVATATAAALFGLDCTIYMGEVDTERQALNAPIQGSAADIMKVAMLGIAGDMIDQRLESRMLLQVHDELIFEVATGEWDALEAIVRTRMAGAADLRVPLEVQVGRGANWDAAAH